MINSVFITLVFVTIKVKLIKNKNKIQRNQGGNNLAYNKDLAQDVFLFTICMFGVLAGILGLSGNNIEMFEQPLTRFAIYFLADMTHALFALVIIPGILVFSNPGIKESIKEIFVSVFIRR